mmetsp:Transcript_63756/g.137161  ORF Transcript_63756/g.137161 Transcript_63756/m.137161 type:complete len:548 (-) Transcript_63756:28-1671(-)
MTGAMDAIPVATLRHQDTLRSSLMEAITRDDPVKIHALVQRGAPLYQHYYHSPLGPPGVDAHVRDSDLVNPVDWAALELRFRAAMQLLELGDGRKSFAEVRPRPQALEELNLGGQTKVALNLAAQYGHLGLMRMLLERDAFVAQKSRTGASALHVAVEAGRADAAALLLQNDAWAVEEQRAQVLQLAEERELGAVFSAAGVIFHQAVGRCSPDGDQELAGTFDLLDLGGTSELPSRCASPVVARPDSPLRSSPATPSPAARRDEYLREGASNAIMQGHILKEQGPSPDGITSWGWSPYRTLPVTPMSAAAGGAASVVRPGSVSSSMELSSWEVKLRGELSRAIRKGDFQYLDGLVRRGAPLNASLDIGFGEQGNCVDWACINEKPDMALRLLELADGQGIGNTIAIQARAAFFWSVSQGYLEVLHELLQRGTDPGQPGPAGPNGENQSALTLAVLGSRKAEILELLKYGAWDREPESSCERLTQLASARKPVAEAFQEAGVCDFSDFLAPLVLPFRDHGIWGPNYPRESPVHWEEEMVAGKDPPAVG